MVFNPKDYIRKIGQKDYLDVVWRVKWFRAEYPNHRLSTELLLTTPSIVFRATIYDENGNEWATGHGSAPTFGQGQSTWKGREIEKAETSAIGRALKNIGFGTEYAHDEEDSDVNHLADAPISNTAAKETSSQKSINDVDAALGTTPPTLTDEQAFIFNLMQIILPMCKHENHARNAIEKAIEDSAIGKGDSLDKAAGVMLLRRMKSQWGLTEDESRGVLPEALGMTMKEYLTANPRDYSGIWATLTARYAEMPE